MTKTRTPEQDSVATSTTDGTPEPLPAQRKENASTRRGRKTTAEIASEKARDNFLLHLMTQFQKRFGVRLNVSLDILSNETGYYVQDNTDFDQYPDPRQSGPHNLRG